jgi:hypothetical protein
MFFVIILRIFETIATEAFLFSMFLKLRLMRFDGKKDGLYRLHTAILNRPLSNAATKEV